MAKAKKNDTQAVEQKATPAKETKKETKATVSNSVWVGLNHPHGINFVMPGGKKLHINGNAEFLRGAEKGVIPIGRYGLTQVDRSAWEYIKKTYGGMEIFKSGLIFEEENKVDASDRADEMAETRHGREPVSVEEQRNIEEATVAE